MSRSEPGATGHAARGAAAALGLLLAIATLAACLETGPACGDGFCPSGTVCTAVGDRCVYPEQLQVCLGIVDDTACVIRGNRDGMCRGQVCMPIVCGDGVADGDEQCDGADLAGVTDCLGLADGYHQAGAISCGSDCSYDRTACGPRCGDGIVQAGLEACDGPPVARTCTTEGFYGGVLACSAGCQIDASACEGTCGDGVRTAGEACDGFDVGDRSCTSEGFYGGQLRCATTSCGQVDTSACTGRCGDGARNGDELCDGTAMAGLSCQTYGWYGGTMTCGDDCVSVDRGACTGYCGDGIRNGTELCDGLDQGGDSCTTFGAILGALGCNAFCQPTLDACYWGQLKPIENQPVPTPVTGWGTSADDIWIIDQDGALAHFDGIEWRTMDQRIARNLTQIWGFASNDVWTYSSDGVLSHFDGRSWSTRHPPFGPGTTAWASSSSDIWILEDSTPRMRSFDGVSWADHDLPADIASVWGTGANNTWAISVEGNLYQRVAGAWTVDDSLPGVGSTDVWGTSVDDVFTSRKFETEGFDIILHYDGEQWREVGHTLDTIEAGWSLSSTDSWVIGTQASKRVAIHYEGWRFEVVTSSIALSPTASWSTATGQLWAIANGEVSVLDGRDWRFRDISSGQMTTAIAADATSTAWANSDGGLQRFNGNQWLWELPAETQVKSIWSMLTDVIWIGTNASVGYFDGDAWTWHATTGSIESIAAASDDDIWAVGPDDVLQHDGNSWHSAADLHLGGGTQVATGNQETWIIANDNAYRRNGNSWDQVRSPLSAATRVYVAGPDAVWLFGERGTIARFDGDQWTTDRVSTRDRFVSTWGTGPRQIWAVSSEGRVHHFDGVSWTPVDATDSIVPRVVAGNGAGNVWLAGGHGSAQQLLAQLPTPYGGACAEPLRTFCNVSLRGHTAQTTDGPADCGAGAHAGGELAYKIEVPVTGRLTARVTSRHDVDVIALGADAGTGCDTGACASDGAGTEVELEVRQGDVYYLVVGARDAAAPFTLDVACEKS